MLFPQTWYLYFLVAAVVLYWAACRTAIVKKWFLIVISVGLLATLQPKFTIALLAWVALVYVVSTSILTADRPRRFRLLMTILLALLAYLSFFKYLPSVLTNLLTLFSSDGLSWLEQRIVLPLGISYITFRFLHYLIDAYRGSLADYSKTDFLLYSVFFPIVPAGPIERIEHFFGQADLRWSTTNFSYGTRRILTGAAKKLILVDAVLGGMLVFPLQPLIFEQQFHLLEWTDVWIFLIASFLYAYLDFSAYSDLAIGTSRLFGFRIQENFKFPIFRANLSQFWKCWHMSLSGWCRDYIYMPVLAKTRRPRLALYLSMMTIGAWHFVNFNWLLWGALHATGLVILMQWQSVKKRYVRFNVSKPIAYGLGNLVTFLYVSWVFAFVSVPSPVVATQVFVYAATGQLVL